MKRIVCSARAPVALRHQLRRERGVVFHDARLAPDLDAPAVRVVDQKEIGLGIVGKIALRDELPVAGEVGEGDGLLVEHAEEPGRPAAMLDVGLAVAVRGGEKDARLRFDESLKVGRDAVCQAPPPPMRVGLARALADCIAFTVGVKATSLE